MNAKRVCCFILRAQGTDYSVVHFLQWAIVFPPLEQAKRARVFGSYRKVKSQQIITAYYSFPGYTCTVYRLLYTVI